MNEIEKRFRDRVGQSLERYCPNDSVLNNLSTYLIREAVEVLNESGIADIKGFESNSDIDKLAFLHAVKDLSLFSAQTVMIQVLKKSFTEVRNIVPLETRQTVLERKESTSTSGRVSSTTGVPDIKLQDKSPNEMSFNIDLSDVPKFHRGVMEAKSTEDREQKTREKDTDRNIFQGNIEFDLDDINQRTVSNRVSFGNTSGRKSSTSSREEATDDEFYEDLRTDASDYTEDSYSSVPNISLDDDY